ncbi:MAG TPA: hypothetical protein VI457_09375 [Methylococcaceae bacterium]|nr:hypothetical protein [Methylococcaceae bacterium]
MASFWKFWILLLAFTTSTAWGASPYQQPLDLATQWLSGQKNADGSWGATEDIQPLYTSAAVRALAAAHRRQGAYYAGTTWLESHAGGNVDFAARRVGALTARGDSLAISFSYLQNAQARDGTAYSG